MTRWPRNHIPFWNNKIVQKLWECKGHIFDRRGHGSGTKKPHKWIKWGEWAKWATSREESHRRFYCVPTLHTGPSNDLILSIDYIEVQRVLSAPIPARCLPCSPPWLTCVQFNRAIIIGNVLKIPRQRFCHRHSLHPPKFLLWSAPPILESGQCDLGLFHLFYAGTGTGRYIGYKALMGEGGRKNLLAGGWVENWPSRSQIPIDPVVSLVAANFQFFNFLTFPSRFNEMGAYPKEHTPRVAIKRMGWNFGRRARRGLNNLGK